MIEEVTCGLLFVQPIQHSLIPRPLSLLCLVHVDCVGEPGNKAAFMPGLMIDDDVIMRSCPSQTIPPSDNDELRGQITLLMNIYNSECK